MAIDNWNDFPVDVVDAHHHLWDLSAINYPWLMAKGVTRFFGDPTPIQKDYLVSNFKNDFGRVPIADSVHIQVGASAGENIAEAMWLQDQHQTHGLPSAFVAYCDLEQPARTSELDQLVKLPAFRGIRQIVGRHPEEDKETGTASLLDNPNWLDGLKELEKRDLSFDLQLIPDQMDQVADLLAQVKSLRVALCHCGSPWYRDSQGLSMWSEGLKKLAALPNVYCKISGLGMFDHYWTVKNTQSIFETVIESFGASRCMFGSNFPVDKLYASYQLVWQCYAELSNKLPAAEKQQLFSENCRQFYRIGRQQRD